MVSPGRSYAFSHLYYPTCARSCKKRHVCDEFITHYPKLRRGPISVQVWFSLASYSNFHNTLIQNPRRGNRGTHPDQSEDLDTGLSEPLIVIERGTREEGPRGERSVFEGMVVLHVQVGPERSPTPYLGRTRSRNLQISWLRITCCHMSQSFRMRTSLRHKSTMHQCPRLTGPLRLRQYHSLIS
jgi:hypothetical protein